jgi:hypothetical protein
MTTESMNTESARSMRSGNEWESADGHELAAVDGGNPFLVAGFVLGLGISVGWHKAHNS